MAQQSNCRHRRDRPGGDGPQPGPQPRPARPHGRAAQPHRTSAPAAWSTSTATRARSSPAESIEDFVASLERPRAIIIMVKAGDPTDAVIDELVPLLEPGDIVIDCGNAHFTDTRRREAALRGAAGCTSSAAGVSGGEEGALNGPSIMPGGSAEAYAQARPDLRVDRRAGRRHARAACTSARTAPATSSRWCTTASSTPTCSSSPRPTTCCAPGSARRRREIARDLPRVERGRPGVVPHRDHRQGAGAHRRRDRQAVRRHRRSTRPSRRAPAAGPCRTRSTSASRSPASPRPRSRARCPVTRTSARRRSAACRAATVDPQPVERPRRVHRGRAPARCTRRRWSPTRRASTRSRRAARSTAGTSTAARWPRIWRGGCIIRARFLEPHHRGVRRRPAPAAACWSRRTSPTRSSRGVAVWRRVVADAALAGVPTPAFSSSLAYYDGLRAERLPAALIQGLRDYFGAHTYQPHRPRGHLPHPVVGRPAGTSRVTDAQDPARGGRRLSGRPGAGEHATMLKDLGCSPDDAPQRVVHDEDRDACRRLDPAGQARQQGSTPGEADLPAHHVFREVRRDVRQHLLHRVDDRDDRVLKGFGHEPPRHVFYPGHPARRRHRPPPAIRSRHRRVPGSSSGSWRRCGRPAGPVRP